MTPTASILPLLLALMQAPIDAEIEVLTVEPVRGYDIPLRISGQLPDSGSLQLEHAEAEGNLLRLYATHGPGALFSFTDYSRSLTLRVPGPGQYTLEFLVRTTSDLPYQLSASRDIGVEISGPPPAVFPFSWPPRPSPLDPLTVYIPRSYPCGPVDITTDPSADGERVFLNLVILESPGPCGAEGFQRFATIDLDPISAAVWVIGGKRIVESGAEIFLQPRTVETDMRLPGRVSGSFLDARHPGQGVHVEVVEGSDQVVLYWYTFDEQGHPMWLIAQGPNDGLAPTLAVYQSLGGAFPAGPDASTALHEWGEIDLDFDSCDRIIMRWRAIDPAFGEGELDLRRLSRLKDAGCGQAAPEGLLDQLDKWPVFEALPAEPSA